MKLVSQPREKRKSSKAAVSILDPPCLGFRDDLSEAHGAQLQAVPGLCSSLGAARGLRNLHKSHKRSIKEPNGTHDFFNLTPQVLSTNRPFLHLFEH